MNTPARTTTVRIAATLALAALLLLVFAASALAEGFVNTHNWSTNGSLPGQIAEGAGLTVYNGQLYVCDYSNGRVQVFTTDGAYLRQWAVSNPTGIVVNATTETVYVGSSTGVVSKYTPAGDALGALTTFGSGAEQVAGVEGLALDANGNVYATDVGNDRVQVYSSSGTFVRTIGSSGAGDGQFTYPAGIDVDSNGNVYVFDYSAQRVQKFASGGAFLAKWGSSGGATGQFSDTLMLTVDAKDHVFVSDRGNNRIQEFTAAGEYVRSITATGFTSPLGLTFGPNRTLYASRNFSGVKLFRWDWDDTAPALTHDYDGEWHSQPFTVRFTAKDDHTDVPWLRWTLNSVDWTNNGSIAVPVDATTHAYDGFYRPMIGAGDSVSNWAYQTLRIKIDTRAPISTASGAPDGWTNQEVWVHIAATDVGSGVHRSFYDLDGAGLTELSDTGMLLIDTPGVHTLQYFSQDNCADTPNEESANTVQVLIDQSGPSPVPSNNVTVRSGASATFKYTLNDDFSPTCTLKLVIKKKSRIVKTVSLGVKDSNLQVPPHAYNKKMAVKLPAGAYTWTVTATDLAGNKGSYAPKKLTVK
jgi:hypothetical protein